MRVDASRVIFVAYALVLTTATHWPALDLDTGIETLPAPDKIIHMVAFGGLFVLLWRTGWIPRLWLAGLIVLVWAVLDEFSQSIEILQRTSSAQDMVAGQLGVVVACAWYWALAGTGNRVRTALTGAGVLVAATILYLVVPGRQGLTWDMHIAVGLTAIALAIAVAVRVCRS